MSLLDRIVSEAESPGTAREVHLQDQAAESMRAEYTRCGLDLDDPAIARVALATALILLSAEEETGRQRSPVTAGLCQTVLGMLKEQDEHKGGTS